MHNEIWGSVEIIKIFVAFESSTEDFFRRHGEKKQEKQRQGEMSNHSKNQGRPGGGGVVEYQYTRKKNDKIPQNTPNSSK